MEPRTNPDAPLDIPGYDAAKLRTRVANNRTRFMGRTKWIEAADSSLSRMPVCGTGARVWSEDLIQSDRSVIPVGQSTLRSVVAPMTAVKFGILSGLERGKNLVLT